MELWQTLRVAMYYCGAAPCPHNIHQSELSECSAIFNNRDKPTGGKEGGENTRKRPYHHDKGTAYLPHTGQEKQKRKTSHSTAQYVVYYRQCNGEENIEENVKPATRWC